MSTTFMAGITGQALNARSATLIVNSPLRHVTGALAVSAGFAYVLEAEDQFHRSVWFGVMFAGLTGAWFILGSFLALIDTIAVWWTGVLLVVLALGLRGVGLAAVAPGEVDDVGSLDEPLTVLRVVLAVLVGASAGRPCRRGGGAGRGWLVRHTATTGILVLLAGLAATTGAAVARAFSPTGDCGPTAAPPEASANVAATPGADQKIRTCMAR